MRVGLRAATLLVIPAACSLTDLEEYRGGTDAALDAGATGGSVAGTAGWPSGGGIGGSGGGGSGGSGGATDATVFDTTPPDSSGGSGGASPADASCPPGHADCDGNAINGCETTLGTSADCAGCGDACSAPIGTTACVGGACKVTACPTHRADCDGIAGNGCETDLKTTATCGSCTTQCPEAFLCAQSGDPNKYVCACGVDAACLNGGLCYLGAVCVCGGTACQLGERCTLIGTCF